MPLLHVELCTIQSVVYAENVLSRLIEITLTTQRYANGAEQKWDEVHLTSIPGSWPATMGRAGMAPACCFLDLVRLWKMAVGRYSDELLGNPPAPNRGVELKWWTGFRAFRSCENTRILGFHGRTIGMNGCQSGTNVCVSVLQLEFSSVLRISLSERNILLGLTNSWQPIWKNATFARLGLRCGSIQHEKKQQYRP